MTQTIDPVFSSAVLSAPELALNDLDFDALSQAMGGLKGEVDKNPQTAAIILAGGTGERFGKEGGKQLVEIAGKPILTWSAEAFDAVGDIGLIVIVCPEDRCSEYLKRAIDPFPFVTPIVVAPGGRAASSRWPPASPACRRAASTSPYTTAPARSSAPTSSRTPSPR
mgnify:CR=1 FL=1